MEKVNEYLELDGLFFESDTHKWFNDKQSTQYAQKENINGISLPNIIAFVVKKKENNEYDRILMDKDSNEIIYTAKGLEELGAKIDMLKLIKMYGNQNTSTRRNSKSNRTSIS